MKRKILTLVYFAISVNRKTETIQPWRDLHCLRLLYAACWVHSLKERSACYGYHYSRTVEHRRADTQCCPITFNNTSINIANGATAVRVRCRQTDLRHFGPRWHILSVRSVRLTTLSLTIGWNKPCNRIFMLSSGLWAERPLIPDTAVPAGSIGWPIQIDWQQTIPPLRAASHCCFRLPNW